MKNVSVVTTNNIPIEFELATVMQRFLASLLDGLIVFCWLLFVELIVGGMRTEEGTLMWRILLTTPIMFFYHFIQEAFFGGRSIGKRAMGIKVISMSGENPTLSECSIRWAMRMVDIGLSFGGIAILVASSSDKSQRVGDIMANTAVISLKPSNSFSVSDILSIKKNDNYEATYPAVTQFTDDDMLLVKNTLDRLKKYPNDKHKEVAKELVVKVAEKLNIAPPEKKKVAFLKNVLQDYIVLTRS